MAPTSARAALCAAAALLAGVDGWSLGATPPENRPTVRYESPGFYPAPYGGWVDGWAASYGKARALVASMTLAEKVNITGGTGIFMGGRCSGNTGSAPRVGFPQLCLNDGPAGVRQADNVTAFPAGITTGATFDKKLMRQRGSAIGREARGKGVNVWLGPMVGPLGRKPRGGRNWEGFGADLVLQAIGARETIRGVQGEGVIATVKHFIGNEQEMYRAYTPLQYAYSSNIDDRVLHELYMWPFAEAVHAGVGAVMMAYNAVNGSACSQNAALINGLLKEELGFQGFVMTDWLAHMSGVASALAGLDMDMPGDTQVPLVGSSYWMYELARAALNGSVPMDRVNDMATRVVAAWVQMGQDGADFPATNFATGTRAREGLLFPGAWPDSPTGVVNELVRVQGDDAAVARSVARDAITLLKNDADWWSPHGNLLLPIGARRPLYVFGSGARAARRGPNACADRSCNDGTLGMGWGSGTVDYPYLDDPLSALRARSHKVVDYASDEPPWGLKRKMLELDAVAVVFLSAASGENTYIVEGNHGDRDHAGLHTWHGGDRLVAFAASRFDNVIVVIHTVGPVLVDNWIKNDNVRSVLVTHLPGQEAGRSLAEVLYGDVSPSGHLPYSITKREEDLPDTVTGLIHSEFLRQPQDTYAEGLLIDYRFLNKHRIRPRFAFGHGLSYTDFGFVAATVRRVHNMTHVPPPPAPKRHLLNYTQPLPDPAEAVAPPGFRSYWRYLYPWLSRSAAESAARDAASHKYPYPDGYSAEQRPVSPPAGGGEGGNPALWDEAFRVDVKVSNTGKFRGKASVQAYLQYPDDIAYTTPVIQLRDFEKTDELLPGRATTVQLRLTRKDISVWDVEQQNWVVPLVGGRYKLWLGLASDDMKAVCYLDDLECKLGDKQPV